MVSGLFLVVCMFVQLLILTGVYILQNSIAGGGRGVAALGKMKLSSEGRKGILF